MDTFIALYRGINVVGKNVVKMQSLRAMHERLGHKNVRNYIQSGNIVFTAKGTANSIARKTAAEFVKEFGFAAKVIVIDARGWGKIVRNSPYAKHAAGNPRLVHAGICQGEPCAADLAALLARTGRSEAFMVKNSIVYLHAPDGYGKSKFAAGMEKACGVPMTVRNWRTVEALFRMVNDAP